ncbi:MAG: translation initiation factor [Patescibacteria group bacterium]|nr:translation initiation factor [Patescibacteria group bacterium]
MSQKILINNAIRSPDLRVIDDKGKNLGVIRKEEALRIAKDAGLDLIEISRTGDMSVAKIADYGKYQYELSKKLKEVKAKSAPTETKNIQLSVGISENDISIKTHQAAEWLKDGDRVKFELQVKGRGKYMEENFLKERLNRVLAIIPCDYKIAEPLKKLPRGGFSIIIENK